MAKLPQTGVSYQCLYEREHTLREVIAGLGFKPLRKKAEQKIRTQLGFALANWEEPYTATEVRDVVRSLKIHAKNLNQIALIGTIARGGLVNAHDLAVSAQVVQVLTSNPTVAGIEATHAYLLDFSERAMNIASACKTAASTLDSTKGKSGKGAYNWYDEFTRVHVKSPAQKAFRVTLVYSSRRSHHQRLVCSVPTRM